MHDVHGTNVDIAENDVWNVIQASESVAASGEGSILTFPLPAVTNQLTLLKDSWIRVQGYYLLAADCIPSVPTNASVSVPPFLSTVIFSTYELTINGTVVRANTDSLTPYATLISNLMNQEYGEFATQDFTQGNIYDTTDQGFTDNYSLNLGAAARRTLYLAGTAVTSPTRTFSMTVKFSDIFDCPDAIPPNSEIRLAVTRNQNTCLIQGSATDVGTVDPIYKMTAATWMVRRLRLTEAAASALDMSWEKRAARMNFQRIRQTSRLISTGATSLQVNNVLPGSRPSRVVVAVIPTIHMTSAASPYYGCTLEGNTVMTDIYLTLDGSRRYPLQSFSQLRYANLTHTLSLSEQYEMYKACARVSPALPASQLTNLNFYFFDTSRSGDSSGRVWDKVEDVAIQFHANLSAALTANHSVMVFSFTNAVCEIEHTGAVTVTM